MLRDDFFVLLRFLIKMYSAAVFSRSHTDLFFEHAHEMRIIIAAFFSNALQSVVCLQKKILCMTELAVLYITHAAYIEY